jgi:hypothetical protein
MHTAATTNDAAPLSSPILTRARRRQRTAVLRRRALELLAIAAGFLVASAALHGRQDGASRSPGAAAAAPARR